LKSKSDPSSEYRCAETLGPGLFVLSWCGLCM